MRKTFIEAAFYRSPGPAAPTSLPLMRKTFIEARWCWRILTTAGSGSLPLMWKTFIEAVQIGHA